MIDWLKKATSANISGNYKFHIKSSSQQVDTSSTICVTTYTDKSESAMLPCHYKWFRVRNGIMEESFKFRGNSYVCDSSDIGAVVRAEVISNDQEYSGQASIQFGPVKLSAEVKKNLMDALTNRSAFIRGHIYLTNYHEKQCQFKIFEDMIKICHTQSQLNFSFNYSIFEPRIEIVPRDATKLCIIFTQNTENNAHNFMHGLFGKSYQAYGPDCRMEIRFGNRLSKDIFLLTLKAFYTKKQLSSSVVIHKIEDSSFNENQQLSLLFEIESLRAEITRLHSLNENKEKERSRLFEEVCKLERQIQNIVTIYTKMAEQKFATNNLNQSFTVLTAKKDQVFGRKCQNLQKQNLNLNQRIRLLTNEIDDIRFNSSVLKKNQTVIQPNFAHMTTIRTNNQFSRNDFTNFENVLDHVSESRVTEFCEDSFLMEKKFQKVNQQKQQLERKLEKSFKTIDDLEKKLKTGISNQSMVSIGGQQNKLQMSSLNNSLFSMSLDLERVQSQNHRLFKTNQSLRIENKNLQNSLSNAPSKIIIKPNPSDSMKSSITNQFQSENESLKRQIFILKQNIKAGEVKSQNLNKEKMQIQRRVEQLIRQLSMNRKNQEVLNRSQHLSMEMDNYNEEQIKVLKEHNELLLAQNEKLSKAVQKYMGEARQNIKLRKQILSLKQKQNHKLLNPEISETKSYHSKHNYSNYNILDTSQLMHRF